MRRAIKYVDSQIITENLKYIKGNSANNKKIAVILFEEQKGFCAYTDEYISITDLEEIEHFNPTIKYTDDDNYKNWFLVKSKWNRLKSTKWEDFQPLIHPTANDFEQRIIYLNGDYIVSSDEDLEAKRLIDLLQLDNVVLADKRKKYIKRKREDMASYGQDGYTYFSILLNANPCEISYPRAIKEEFGVDILEGLT